MMDVLIIFSATFILGRFISVLFVYPRVNKNLGYQGLYRMQSSINKTMEEFMNSATVETSTKDVSELVIMEAGIRATMDQTNHDKRSGLVIFLLLMFKLNFTYCDCYKKGTISRELTPYYVPDNILLLYINQVQKTGLYYGYLLSGFPEHIQKMADILDEK